MMDVKKQKGWKSSDTQFNTLSDLITTTCETICYINERNGGGKVKCFLLESPNFIRENRMKSLHVIQTLFFPL